MMQRRHQQHQGLVYNSVNPLFSRTDLRCNFFVEVRDAYPPHDSECVVTLSTITQQVIDIVAAVTTPQDRCKVLINIPRAWILMASAENARELRSCMPPRFNLPYGSNHQVTPTLYPPQVTGMYGGAPTGPHHGNRGRQLVPLKGNMDDDRQKKLVMLQVAWACGVRHGGWLNANAAIYANAKGKHFVDLPRSAALRLHKLLCFHLDESEASAPVNDRRVVQAVNLSTLHPSELDELLYKMCEVTSCEDQHKVLVNIHGWMLMASQDSAVKLQEFVQTRFDAATYVFNSLVPQSPELLEPFRLEPYVGPITPDVRKLFFRSPAGRDGPRIADHPCRRSRGSHCVPVPTELRSDDVHQIEVLKGTLRSLIAEACGISHNGWLNANTTIELVETQMEPIILSIDEESEAQLPGPRKLSVTVILDSYESAQRFSSLLHGIRG